MAINKEHTKAIAKFLGWEELADEEQYYGNGKSLSLDEMNFHSSWNAIMPVVEKINTMDSYRYAVRISHFSTEVYDNIESEKIIGQPGHSFIEGVYYAVVRFLEWYEKNK